MWCGALLCICARGSIAGQSVRIIAACLGALGQPVRAGAICFNAIQAGRRILHREFKTKSRGAAVLPENRRNLCNTRPRAASPERIPEPVPVRKRQHQRYHARRDYNVATKTELVEILDFKHFYEHCTFGETGWSKRGKRLEKYVKVVVAVEIVTVGTKLDTL